jgi:DNA-binding CsgD family transcriptional regulator
MFSTKNETFENLRRFQKCLRRATAASTLGEAEAAEAAARRLMETYKINPLKIPDKSVYDFTDFSDNALLLRLRQEYMAQQFRNKHTHKRGPKRKGPRQKVDLADQERIRVLCNEGLSPKAIGEQLGYSEYTMRTQRHTHLRIKRDWLIDGSGKLQWVTSKISSHLVNVKVTVEMLGQIHEMLQRGFAPVEIRDRFGLTRGQIAGIKGRYDEQIRSGANGDAATSGVVAGHADSGSGGET